MQDDSRNSVIPDNVLTKGMFMDIPVRRWIEAGVSLLVVLLISSLIPFVKTVRIMFIIIIGAGAFLLFLRGIKNRSVTQFIWSAMRFTRRKRILHLLPPNYMKRIKYEEVSNESLATQFTRSAKEKLNGFIDKYSTKEDS